MKYKLKIGLLPLFLELYDEVLDAGQAADIRAFADEIDAEYGRRGVETVRIGACRVSSEFHAAVKRFEEEEVDAILTLHLAYSPSLESIDALAGTALPLIVLDTTPDAAFDFDHPAERILFNHGIHGVQDLCNLLIRRGKPFAIEAGHWKDSDVLDRTVSRIRGCAAARAFRNRRVGLVGSVFAGMGDFAVPFELLKRRYGIDVVETDSKSLARRMPAPGAAEVRAEAETDLARCEGVGVDGAKLAETEAAGLAVRRWMEDERLDAFTMNFGDITGLPGLPVVPFLEASKAMSRGIGYGGEGDVLTAAFCSALMRALPETTFTEMFCPDWQGGRIFMSHMGEMNLLLTAAKPVLRVQPYPFSAAADPVIAFGCLKSGSAVLFNLASGPDDTFTLIAVPVEVCDAGGADAFPNAMRGWVRPHMPVADCPLTVFPGRDVTCLAFGNPSLDYDLEASNASLQAEAFKRGWHSLAVLRPQWSAEQVDALLSKPGVVGAKVYYALISDDKTTRDKHLDASIFEFMPPHQLDVLNARRSWLTLHVPKADRLGHPDNIREIRELRERWPDVTVVIAHLGRCYTLELAQEALPQLADEAGLYFDNSAVLNPAVHRYALERLGPRRILYGTDNPIFYMRGRRQWHGRSYVNRTSYPFHFNTQREAPEIEANYTLFMYEALRGIKTAATDLQLSREEIDMVFRTNAERLLLRTTPKTDQKTEARHESSLCR